MRVRAQVTVSLEHTLSFRRSSTLMTQGALIAIHCPHCPASTSSSAFLPQTKTRYTFGDRIQQASIRTQLHQRLPRRLCPDGLSSMITMDRERDARYSKITAQASEHTPHPDTLHLIIYNKRTGRILSNAESRLLSADHCQMVFVSQTR